MKKILVTGALGQLGKEISDFYSHRPDIELVLTDVDELDITRIEAVTEYVKKIKPYAIINCAAYTAVDACEDNLDIAFKVNAIGPRNLAIAASKTDSKIVHISTDYIFDGKNKNKYTEFDIPNPCSVYGASKLEGENFIKEFSKKYFIIRTAWLYGEGKNFVNTMLKLSETKEEISVVNDQYGTPTSTKTVVEIIDLLLFTDNYGIYNGTCEGMCSWADFAEEIFRLAGKNTIVKRISSDEYPAKATRPANSVLDNYMLRIVLNYTAPDWKQQIEKYIKDRMKK